MDVPASLAEIASLTVDERLSIVEAIWDTIAADSASLPLTPAQRDEIERRLTRHRAHPDEVVPWEAVKAEALARARM